MELSPNKDDNNENVRKYPKKQRPIQLKGPKKCRQCKTPLTRETNTTNWFMDIPKDKEDLEGRSDKKVAHCCDNCRKNNSIKTMFYGPVRCERCFINGEWGHGKWNLNEGHIYSYARDMILCYDCHGILYYNK